MSESPVRSPAPKGRPSPALILFLIFPILGILAALITVVSSGGGAAGGPLPTPAPVTLANPSLIDQPAPNFTLEKPDGTTVRLSSYRGRVVFVNFWATWCEPCQRELPAFQAFMAQQGQQGAMVLAVNAGETADQITSYFSQHQITAVPALLDPDLQVYDQYNIQNLPTTYAVDAAGVVRYLHLGEMKMDDLDSYVAALSSENVPSNSG